MEYTSCYYRILQYTVISEDGTRTVHRPTFRKEATNLEAERASYKHCTVVKLSLFMNQSRMGTKN